MEESKKPHYDVIITTPGHSMNQLYVLSLVGTIKELEKRGISWAYFSQYASNVVEARENTILGGSNIPESHRINAPMFNSVTYNKIFMIDSDIEWHPNDFMKLYESDKDVVVGAYLMASGDRTTLCEWSPEAAYEAPPHMDKQQILDRTEPFIVTGSGLGFACIKSGVFEKVTRPWFTPMVVEVPDRLGGSYMLSYSEDISFILKMRDYGIPTWCDPLVRVNHIKTVKVGWGRR
jgi:hypothetical protein